MDKIKKKEGNFPQLVLNYSGWSANQTRKNTKTENLLTTYSRIYVNSIHNKRQYDS